MRIWQSIFLVDLAEHGRISRAAIRSGMPKQAIDYEIATDPIFAVAVNKARLAYKAKLAYQDSVVLTIKKAAK